MRSKRSMAPDTASPTSEERELQLKWSNRVSLTPRILAVNIFALALLAGGFSYLDSYRSRIVDSRVANWDIRIWDTVADNASSGLFVLGAVLSLVGFWIRIRPASS